MKKMIATMFLALIPAAAGAETALEQLGRASGVDVKPMMMQVKELSQMVERPSIPRGPQDVLADCSIIDAKTFRAYSLPEAAKVLNGCLSEAYASGPRTRRAYTVSARQGRFGVRLCPEARDAGSFSCQAIVEVEGLIITVDGQILTGDPVLENLQYSVQKRGGKLLGFSATVDNKAAILK